MGRIVKGFGQVVPGVVLDARAEAKRLVADARAEADAIRGGTEAARAAARAEGFEAGRAEGLAEVAAVLGAARADAEREREGAMPAALALALKMTEKIVGRAVELDAALMAEIAGAALESSRPRGGGVRLRLHPDDLAAADARREALAARAPAAAGLELVADPAVGRYGCVVETAHGRVDARLETQLAALERALAGGAHG